MSDVLERIRKAETMPLDADGKVALWETLQDALAEIARLRLTDAEREAIYRASQYLSQNDVFEGMAEDAATLRGLMSRTGDCPASDNAADRDNGSNDSE